MLRAQPPTHRPIWLVVLSATMLLYGGLTLVRGLLTVRDPGMVVRQPVRNVPRPPAAEAAAGKLEPVLEGIIQRHRGALRADAIASIAFGMLTLYAVAAVLSRDRHGRLLALLTAVFGIVYEVAEVPLQVRITRELVAEGGTLLNEILSAAGDTTVHTQAELLTALNIMAAVFAAVGVGWCLLLLRYFGGRHGRELYGLPLRRS